MVVMMRQRQCHFLRSHEPGSQYVCLTGMSNEHYATHVRVSVDIHATANTLFYTVVQGSAHSQWDRSNRKMGVVEDIDALMIAMTRF